MNLQERVILHLDPLTGEPDHEIVNNFKYIMKNY